VENRRSHRVPNMFSSVNKKLPFLGEYSSRGGRICAVPAPRETDDLTDLKNNPNLYTKSYAYDLKDSNFKPSGKEFLFYKYKYLYVRVICDQGV